MQTIQQSTFRVIGIKVRTHNNGASIKDIPALWDQFMNQNIANRIPNRIDSEILCLYTNYEGDHTQPYDTIIGCRVSTLEEMPSDMIGQTFSGDTYTQFTAKGDLSSGIVYNAWLDIWKAPLQRNFKVDYEVYKQQDFDPTNTEVTIYVGIS